MVERIKARFAGFEMLPFQATNLGRSKYLLTGTMTRVPTQKTRKVLRIDLALTELGTGNVVAQATTLAREDQLDHTPLPYYKDSPVLMKDKVIEGYVRSTVTPAGQKADPYYLARIAAASQIHEATSLYNAERYQEALGQYRDALTTPHGEQLRTLSGIYLSNVRLGRMAEAEKAFARVVALGFAYNELGVKLLFNPGSTEFWSDPKISGTYAMWLRQIARESTGRQRLPEHRRTHQQQRPGRGQRRVVAAAGHLRAPASRRRARRARPAHPRDRQGLQREHRRQRHRQCHRRARPARRVQDHSLRLTPAAGGPSRSHVRS